MDALTGLISPELVLVDPVLRAAALTRLREDLEAPLHLGAPLAAAPRTAWEWDQPVRNAAGPSVAARPHQAKGGDETRAVIRALLWCLAVLVQSAVVVGVVLGTVYVSRLAF